MFKFSRIFSSPNNIPLKLNSGTSNSQFCYTHSSFPKTMPQNNFSRALITVCGFLIGCYRLTMLGY